VIVGSPDEKEMDMTIYRIGETQARRETIEALRDFLLSIIPNIKASQGCESVMLYQSKDDPTKFTMIEIWDSAESHQASVKNIPPEMLGEIRPLLASPPSGGYFEKINQK
jgi:quinol monooxygenase YgiN